MEVTSYVCRLCLELNPQDVSLISHKCKSEYHFNSVRVPVQWNPRKNQLEEIQFHPPIRPRPSVQLRNGGRFILCNLKRCRGDRCTYPHSIEERDAWNAELLREQGNWQEMPQMSNGDWPPLPSSQTKINTKLPNTRCHPQRQNYPATLNTPRLPDATVALSVSPGYSTPKPIPVSELESRLGISEGIPYQQRELQKGLGNEGRASQSELSKASLDESSGNDSLYSTLLNNNYKSKFSKLIVAERETHEGILRERCNGSYQVMFAGRSCPKGIILKNQHYKLYAYVDGISVDNLSHINQACETITITNHKGVQFTADAYRQRQTKRLVAAFIDDCYHSFNEGPMRLEVKFNLKKSYFKDLLNSVQALNSSIISRIMPNQESFGGNTSAFVDINGFLPYFSDEQAHALRIIAASTSTDPPLLLTGAFGTGKSRLLALSAQYFQTKLSMIRILVCTQQRVSADKFLEYYLDTSVEAYSGKVLVIRDYGYSHLPPEHERYYKHSKDFREEYKKYSNILVITTCLTAPHLSYLGPYYFTHIIIDECSQMREPEAVAPLYLAGNNTKLIFAGDPNQVGPALLVLGDIAQKNGLGTSLLQRLLEHYGNLGGLATQSIITLTQNYRCHREILKLVGGLFYNNLCWAENESPPVTHRDYKFPVVFICSSVDEDQPTTSTYENEAEVIVQTVIKVAKGSPAGWPKPIMPHLFVVSPCEEQVARMNEKFRKKPLQPLPDVKSTASIQGREFQAVFLSTSEPIHSDGASRNPTRSLCDPYVFNTAVTRAKSLVVGVGNPFLLLKMEKQIVKLYGKKGMCWSTFLQLCIKKGTLEFSEEVSTAQQRHITEKLQKSLSAEKDLHETIKKLEAQLLEKQQQLAVLSPHGTPVNQAFQAYMQLPIHPSQQAPVCQDSQVQQYMQSPVYPLQQDSQAQHSMQSPVYPLQQDSQAQHSVQSPVYPPQHAQHSHFSQAQHYMQRPVHPQQQHSSSPFHEVSLNQFPDYTNTDIQRLTPPEDMFEELPSPGYNSTMSETGTRHKYNRESLLGYGGFGVVHQVSEMSDGNEYALKVIHLDEGRTHQKKWREVDALIELSYTRIVKYIDSWEEEASAEWWSHDGAKRDSGHKRCLFILMELCQKDTLKHWLIKHSGENSRNKKAMISYFEQIVDALCFIHEKNYIHRDLKPSNILFSCESDKRLKVGDFGLVTFDQPPADTRDADGNMERQATGSSFRGAGTFPYISPEQQDHSRRKKVDAKTDIYALGIILFELHYPKRVNEEERAEVFDKVRNGTFPAGFQDQMPKVHPVVRLLTAMNSKRRPSAAEIQRRHLVNLKKMNTKAKKTSIPIL